MYNAATVEEEEEEEGEMIQEQHRPTKIRRLNSHDEDDAKEVEQSKSNYNNDDTIEQSSTNKNIIDAKTFIFKSPASEEEIISITQKIRNQIDVAYDVLSKGGYEAYRKLKRKQSGLNELVRGEGDNSDGDGGMDTDDEIKQAFHDQERLAMLEEAVVKGTPRRYQGMAKYDIF